MEELMNQEEVVVEETFEAEEGNETESSGSTALGMLFGAALTAGAVVGYKKLVKPGVVWAKNKIVEHQAKKAEAKAETVEVNETPVEEKAE